MEKAIVFGRQWHAPGSQEGLKEISIVFERLLAEHKLDQARSLVLNTNLLTRSYRKRLYRRLENIEDFKSAMTSGIRRPVRIKWLNFWPNIDKYDNQLIDFIRFAAPELNIEVVNEEDVCDISISSCYGAYQDVDSDSQALKILFLGENVRPSYTPYDFSITSDLDNYRGRNCYLPLWLLEIDLFNKSFYSDRRPDPIDTVTNGFSFNPKSRNGKLIFIGNNQEPFRISYINELQRRGLDIDLFGSHTKPVDNKKELYSIYSCIISFENGYSPGYITEKLIHGFQSKTPMAYYGCLEGSVMSASEYPLIMYPGINMDTAFEKIKKIIHMNKCTFYKPLLDSERIFGEMDRIKISIRSFLKQFIF
jgi:hypothetical protein